MVNIAIANQKGGVGKTTVTLGLAEAAAQRGLRVLVVDCDPQANATAGLGAEAAPYSLTDILENEYEVDLAHLSDFVTSSSWAEHIDVISADPHLTAVETAMSSDPMGAFDRLSRSLSGVRDYYDIIFFDCPPSLGLLTINALFAADEVIIVSAASAWSYDGVETFTQNVERVAKRRGGKPRVAGVIVNNVLRTRDSKYWQGEITNHFDFPFVSITARAAIAEAAASSSPIRSLRKRPGAEEALTDFDNAFLTLIGIPDSSPQKEPTTSKPTTIVAQGISAAL